MNENNGVKYWDNKLNERSKAIIRQNLDMAHDHTISIIEMVDRQSKLIDEFISLGHSRNDFFKYAQLMKKNDSFNESLNKAARVTGYVPLCRK